MILALGLALVPQHPSRGESGELPNQPLDPQWVSLLPAASVPLHKLNLLDIPPVTLSKPHSPPVPDALLALPPPREAQPLAAPEPPTNTEVADIEEDEIPPLEPQNPANQDLATLPGKGDIPQYHWQVQVFAGRSLSQMEESVRLIAQQYSHLLEGLKLVIKKLDNSGSRYPYRLRVIPLADGKAARAWCRKFKARGASCLVVRSRACQPP